MAKRCNDGRFNGQNKMTHALVATPDVKQQVNDQLARSVIGDLSAAVGCDNGNGGVQKRLLRAGISLCVDRVMLQYPELIHCFAGAGPGEFLHPGAGVAILDLAELPDDDLMWIQ